MKRQVGVALLALALCGGVQAQTNEQLKQMLDQALKTIDDLKGRVKALEDDKQKSAAAATPAAAASAPPAWGAPVVSVGTRAEDASVPDADKARIEVYGQVMLDAIYDFKRMDPDWNATLRPSKIPVVCPGSPGCGKDGAVDLQRAAVEPGPARRSFPRPGAWSRPTCPSTCSAATAAPRSTGCSIWAEMGMFGVGQTYSNFMDIDVFPNTIDYWGPSGMVFVRNPQLRITPWSQDGMGLSLHAGGAELGASTPAGSATFAPELADSLTGWNRLPDLTAAWRMDGDWGHVKAAGLLRQVGYQSTLTPDGNPSGTKTGYGLNLTGALKLFGKSQLNGGLVWGKAIASYMNDGGVDLAPGPIVLGGTSAETVQSLGWLAYYNHWWTDQWSSTIGFSQHQQDNTAGQSATAFRRGSYGNLNVLYYPTKNVTTGLEFVWGELEQKDGQSATDYRLQFSTKVTF